MSVSFGAALGDIFKTEKKWMTILGLSLCTIIPVVGPIIATGFLFRRFTRERCGHPAEDFEFNFFGEYLKYGLWPFLATFVLSLVIIPLVFVLMIPMFIGAAVAEEGNEVAGLILMGVGFLLYFAAIVMLMLFTFPVMLRSGLMMDFKAGYSWAFIGSFIKKVGLSLIGYYLLLVLIALPLSIVGYIALFVGVYVVAAWIQVAMNHLVFQHYDLYVERGGEPIQIADELVKELAVPPVPSHPNPPLPQSGEGAPAAEPGLSDDGAPGHDSEPSDPKT